jgi:large subunit ribosomal protein L4
MKIDLYTQTGEKNGQVELQEEFFGTSINGDLMHQALVRQQLNGRVAIAHTKTRSDVRGGGRKPFKQKGTGNARQGTIRAPHMRGGGAVFGPKNTRVFNANMPKKQRRKALFSALSVKAASRSIIALDKYESDDIKTKTFADMISKLPINRNVLVVIPEKNEVIQKSSSNLPNVKTILVNYLNIADLQKYRKILFLKDSIAKMSEIFGSKKSVTKTA